MSIPATNSIPCPVCLYYNGHAPGCYRMTTDPQNEIRHAINYSFTNVFAHLDDEEIGRIVEAVMVAIAKRLAVP